MEQTGVSKPGAHAQSSIRSFFQPKSPTYTPSPGSQTSTTTSNNSTPPPLPPSVLRPPPPNHSTPLQGAPPSRSISSAQFAPLIPTSIPTPHPQAVISRVQEQHVQQLRRINSLLLPIAYPDNFYHAITSTTTIPNFSRVVLWTDSPSSTIPEPAPKVIGGIVCRLDLDPATQTCAIYVQSLGILSPYRTFGLATALLNEVVKYGIEQKVEPCPITSLYAHVWTENEDALKWYQARGFSREGPVIDGYYRRLKPDTAVLMRRIITPSDHLRQTSSPAQSPPVLSAKPSRPVLNNGVRGVSYQTKGPAHEWNDLPSDILVSSKSATPRTSARPSPNASTTSLLSPPTTAEGSDGGSSRSSSTTRDSAAGGTVRGKKKRVYPAAAFGS